ncbi:MAG: hypothetical protein WCQ47_04915 [bacterium]
MANERKRSIKDILGELDLAEKSRATNKLDITGLEQQIPIVGEDLAKPMEDTPPPIPKKLLNANINKSEPIEIPEPIQEQHNLYAESWSSNQSINKAEELEQKILKLEEDNKKQKALLDARKIEINEYRTRIGDAEAENKKLRGELSNSESNIRINFEAQLNKATIIEEKYNNLAKAHEEMKAKIRRDIRKIRTREKELANKLDMMKSDSETLLVAKDHKILQLKQHIDNLEFEIESLKDKNVTLQEEAKDTEEKAQRVIKALRLSTSLLEVANKEK